MKKLSQEQVREFHEHGCLVAPNVIPLADYEPLTRGITAFLSERARKLQAEGKIADLCENEPFETRFAKLYAQCQEIERGLDIMQALLPDVFTFLNNRHLLDALEDLQGTADLSCNPIQHLRAKSPRALTGDKPDYFYNVPWHQDSGVTTEDSDNSSIITCWTPLVDATVENGCMDLLPDAFKLGHLDHVAEGGTQVDPKVFPNHLPVKPAPCPKGGVVFMHRYTPHRSNANNTNVVRWSLDLRYQPTGQASGRAWQPCFPVRMAGSAKSPLITYEQWKSDWTTALSSGAPMTKHRVKRA